MKIIWKFFPIFWYRLFVLFNFCFFLNNLTNIQFGTDSNDTLEVMNQLVSIVSNNSDLKTKKIVVQKLEYGLLKLNQFGLTNEVEYFTEKLNKIKPKWWEYVIHVLNSK